MAANEGGLPPDDHETSPRIRLLPLEEQRSLQLAFAKPPVEEEIPTLQLETPWQIRDFLYLIQVYQDDEDGIREVVIVVEGPEGVRDLHLRDLNQVNKIFQRTGAWIAANPQSLWGMPSDISRLIEYTFGSGSFLLNGTFGDLLFQFTVGDEVTTLRGRDEINYHFHKLANGMPSQFPSEPERNSSYAALVAGVMEPQREQGAENEALVDMAEHQRDPSPQDGRMACVDEVVGAITTRDDVVDFFQHAAITQNENDGYLKLEWAERKAVWYGLEEINQVFEDIGDRIVHDRTNAFHRVANPHRGDGRQLSVRDTFRQAIILQDENSGEALLQMSDGLITLQGSDTINEFFRHTGQRMQDESHAQRTRAMSPDAGDDNLNSPTPGKREQAPSTGQMLYPPIIHEDREEGAGREEQALAEGRPHGPRKPYSLYRDSGVLRRLTQPDQVKRESDISLQTSDDSEELIQARTQISRLADDSDVLSEAFNNAAIDLSARDEAQTAVQLAPEDSDCEARLARAQEQLRELSEVNDELVTATRGAATRFHELGEQIAEICLERDALQQLLDESYKDGVFEDQDVLYQDGNGGAPGPVGTIAPGVVIRPGDGISLARTDYYMDIDTAVPGPGVQRIPHEDDCLDQLAQARTERDEAVMYRNARFFELQMGVRAAQARRDVAIAERDNLRRLNDPNAPSSSAQDIPPSEGPGEYYFEQLAQARAQRDAVTTQRDELERERDALRAEGADAYYQEQITLARADRDEAMRSTEDIVYEAGRDRDRAMQQLSEVIQERNALPAEQKAQRKSDSAQGLGRTREKRDDAIRAEDEVTPQHDRLQPTPMDTLQVAGAPAVVATHPSNLLENGCERELARIRAERYALVKEAEGIVLELTGERARINKEGDEIIVERDALREAQQGDSRKADGPLLPGIAVSKLAPSQQGIPGIPHVTANPVTPPPVNTGNPFLYGCPNQLSEVRAERDATILKIEGDRDRAIRQRDEAIARRDEAAHECDVLRSIHQEDICQELLAQTQINLDSVSQLHNDAIAERDQTRGDLATRTAERNGARQRVRLLEEEAREAQVREGELRKQLRNCQGQDNPVVVALNRKLTSLQQSFEERVAEALSEAAQTKRLVDIERDRQIQQIEISDAALRNSQTALHEAEERAARLDAELEDARAAKKSAQNEVREVESAANLRMEEFEQDHRQQLALSAERAHRQARIAEEATRDRDRTRAERDKAQELLLNCEREVARASGVESELAERLSRNCKVALEATLQRVDQLEELLQAANARANTTKLATIAKRRGNDRHGIPSEQEPSFGDEQPAHESKNINPLRPQSPPLRLRIRSGPLRRVPLAEGAQEHIPNEPFADVVRHRRQRSTRNPAPNYGAPSSRKRKAGDTGSDMPAKRR